MLIAASKNKHKLVEIAKITESFGMKVITRDEAGVDPDFDVVEDGATFEENSFKKAEAICRICGHPAIADDSGLEVDALNGQPGVYSARFAGEECDDEKNNDKLLELIKDVPDEKRTAKFVSVITIVYPDGRKIVARGECPGRILHERHGNNGFGYDPLFLPDGFDQTFAELSSDVKNEISHRAQALKKLEELLR